MSRRKPHELFTHLKSLCVSVMEKKTANVLKKRRDFSVHALVIWVDFAKAWREIPWVSHRRETTKCMFRNLEFCWINLQWKDRSKTVAKTAEENSCELLIHLKPCRYVLFVITKQLRKNDWSKSILIRIPLGRWCFLDASVSEENSFTPTWNHVCEFDGHKSAFEWSVKNSFR